MLQPWHGSTKATLKHRLWPYQAGKSKRSTTKTESIKPLIGCRKLTDTARQWREHEFDFVLESRWR